VTGQAAGGLIVATFLAAFVEWVEALTIVLAMGVTRGWRSALAGAASALVGLAVVTAVVGYAIGTWLPRSALRLIIGVLLLTFGLQWLRTAILRSAGLRARHDEAEEFRRQADAGWSGEAGRRFGLDSFGFIVSFKGVFLEGVEVVFIVVTFGLSAGQVPVAAASAAVAALTVIGLGLIAHRPLSAVPENVLKFGVGLLLATFGTFWSVEGLGALPGGPSPTWPLGDLALPVIFLGWLLLARVLTLLLPRVRAWGRPETAGRGAAT
jgi:Ca2+/H+ antiporter, TMEM165/GDT1 family